MSGPSSRMLRLLGLLQTHRFWPGAELAEQLGVSPRTLRRDVDRLRELGYPVEAQRGLEGGYQLAAGGTMPPLLLDDDEAVALAIGLRIAAQAAVAGIEETSVRALAKLGQVMPPRLRRRVDALRMATVATVWTGGPGADAGVLATLAQACRDEERVRFAYTTSTGERSTRHVEPHRLVALGQRWYLVAFDLARNDWRTFRVDRVETARTTTMRFRPRPLPAPDAASFVRQSIGNVAPRYEVEALIQAPASLVHARLGEWASVVPVDEQVSSLSMSVDNLDWAILALGSLRVDFEVLQPPELVDELRDWAARFGRLAAPDRADRVSSAQGSAGQTTGSRPGR